MNNFDDIFRTKKAKADNKYQPFNKAEWAENKAIEKEWAYNTIEETLDTIKENPEVYRDFLDVMSKFEKYSTGNILLITAQMPEATRLLDSKTIRENKGYIGKGEKGIVLLEPGEEYTRDDGTTAVSFNTKKMFDVSQTNLGKAVREPTRYETRLLLKALIKDAPCNFEIVDNVGENLLARYSDKDNTIYIREDLPGQDIFRAISQELCYAHLSKDGESRENSMFTAYSAAYVLCEKYGVDTSHFKFNSLPEHFADYTTKEMRADANKVRNLVKDITQDMYKVFEKEKEAKSSARPDRDER